MIRRYLDFWSDKNYCEFGRAMPCSDPALSWNQVFL